jgi:uncharacterized RDD family membrane protein YckC
MHSSQQPKKPPYWQLYLGLAVMLLILFALVQLTPPGWHEVVEIGWCGLITGEAALWLAAHAQTLIAWDAWQNQIAEEDGSPLTPVQRRYRRIMGRQEQKDER